MISLDEHFMRLALNQARLAAQAGEVPVGAVLVAPESAGFEMLACGHNQPIGLKDPTAHAEMTALRTAAQRLGNYRLDGCTLYVTLEPCAMCAQALLHARIKRVVFGAPEPKTGAAGSVLNLFAVPQLNHQTEVSGGVLAVECAQLLQDFFQDRRDTQKRNAQPLRPDALRTPEGRFQVVQAVFPEWANAQHHVYLPAAQGLRLYCLDLGPREASTSLFLHSPGSWWPQAQKWMHAMLQQSQRVIVPDLLGHGQSDKPKKANAHSLDLHAQTLLDLLANCGVDAARLWFAPGQYHLAQRIATLAPERIADMTPVRSELLNPLSPEWLDAPFPDAGHRAGPIAWKTQGWDRDPPEPGQ